MKRPKKAKEVTPNSKIKGKKKLTSTANTEVGDFDQSSAPPLKEGIPIAKILAKKKFKILTHKKMVSLKASSLNPLDSVFDKEEATGNWGKHKLCTKQGFSALEVKATAQSVLDAVHRAYLVTYSGKNPREQFEDRAIIKAFRKSTHKIKRGRRRLVADKRSTGQRLKDLGKDLINIEKKGEISALDRLGDKLRNYSGRIQPGIPRLSATFEHEEFDLWLCRNWVKGEMLCSLAYLDISKSWEKNKETTGSIYDEKLIGTRVKRALKLHRPKKR